MQNLQQKKYLNVVKDFENLHMVKGWAEFTDDKTVLVNGKDAYTAIKFIRATGAVTNIPEIEGLKEIGYLTNVSLFDLEIQPQSITIMEMFPVPLQLRIQEDLSNSSAILKQIS